jgi:Holliday junction resolvase RusA-like endonuclease
MVARRITLHVPLMSKARPRAFQGQKVPYMPAAYKKWKADVRAQLAEWWVEPPLETVNVLSLRFAGPARADLDNLMGAILDCGNQLVWRDDRVSVISKIVGEHKKAKEKDSTIEIRIWYLP